MELHICVEDGYFNDFEYNFIHKYLQLNNMLPLYTSSIFIRFVLAYL
jgi:hypothetical protein